MKIIKSTHLTPLDRKLVKASIEAGIVDVFSKQKRLQIITTGSDGVIKACIYTYESGIGSPRKWQMKQIEFKNK